MLSLTYYSAKIGDDGMSDKEVEQLKADFSKFVPEPMKS